MPLSGITTTVADGGIGRRAPSNDKISGFLIFEDTLPSGFAADDRVKKIFTIQEAEALGILDSLTNGIEVLHYHISEFFRMNPEGELWVGVYADPVTEDWAEITAMQNIAQGEIRQLAIYHPTLDYVASQATGINAVVEALNADGGRLSVLYAPNFDNPTTWSGVADLRALNAPKVSVIIGEDGGGTGAALHVSKSYSISNIGAVLGAVSRAKVQQSIGNPGNFDFSDGSELEVLALSDGTLLTAISSTLLGNLKDKGYTVMRKYAPRLGGSFSERVPTACPATSDYAWLEYNRVIDKAARQAEAALMPTIQAGVRLKSDGTIREEVIGYYQDLVGSALIQMMADGEISGDASDIKDMVLIDPSQDILETSTLQITIKIIPIGVAEFIEINIGLTVQV